MSRKAFIAGLLADEVAASQSPSVGEALVGERAADEQLLYLTLCHGDRPLHQLGTQPIRVVEGRSRPVTFTNHSSAMLVDRAFISTDFMGDSVIATVFLNNSAFVRQGSALVVNEFYVGEL